MFGARTAVHDDGGGLTHDELHAGVCRFVELFASAGVGRGTRLAILSPNAPEFLQALFAASWLGAVIVPLNNRLSADDVTFQLEDAGVTHAVVHPSLLDLAETSGLLTRTHWIIGAELTAELAASAASVKDLLDKGIERAGLPSDPIVQLYTSGTTGRPKGCLLSQAGWLASNANIAHRFGLGSEDVLLGLYPLFHVAGLGLAMTHLMVGGSVIFPAAADADTLWSTIARYRVTVAGLPGLPAALERPNASADGASLRILFGGANMESAQTLRRVAQVLPGATFLGIYGSTEGGNVVTISTAEEELARPGTIGRALLGFDVAILDASGAPLPYGSEGVLGLRGPSVMQGYAGREKETAEALRGGWLHTGDIMRLDADGYLYFVDRDKDMIKPGGENVYSIEVERALLQHPAVADVAVLGVPDVRWGEAVKALVVLAPGAQVTPEDLDAHCLAVLAAFKRPRWYEFTDAIPRSVTGKIVKRELRAQHDTATSIRLRERA